MARILFLTSRYPYPPVGGDKVRAARILEHLARSHEVTLVSFLGPHDRAPRDLPPRLADVRLVRHGSLPAGLEGIRAAGQGVPLQIGFFRSDAMRRAVDRVAAEGRFDLVWAHLLRMAPYAPTLPGVPRVLDLTDCASRASDRIREAGVGGAGFLGLAHLLDASAIRAFEAGALASFDRCLVVSDLEREALAGLPGADRVRAVGNGVDLVPFGTDAIRARTPEILFAGALRTLPNRDAACWFARDVLPEVVRRAGPVRLTIAGDEPPAAVRALSRLPGVRVLGRVSDVRPYLLRATIVACPVRLGSGVQNKVLMALAAGAPVAATSRALEGIGADVSGRVAIGDGVSGLADAAARLLQDPGVRARTGQAGRELARGLSWERRLAAIDDVLHGLGVPEGSVRWVEPTPAGPRRAVVVTGAGGFVGGAIARGLAAAGLDVRGWFRTSHPEIEGVAWTRVDLSDPEALPDLAGVAAVVHAAGLPREDGDPERLFDANVAATFRVLDAARVAGVPRFVLCSSVKATDPGAEGEGSYAASKRDAERLAQAWAEATGGEAVLLRLAPVAGPGSRGDLGRLIRLARLGVSVEPAIGGHRSVVAPGTVAGAVVRLLRVAPRAGCRALVIADPDPRTIADLARASLPAAGRAVHVRIPAPFLRGLARAGDAVRAAIGVRVPFDSARLAALAQDAVAGDAPGSDGADEADGEARGASDV